MTISEKLLFCTSLEPGWRKVRKIGNALEEKKKDEDGKEQGKEGAIRWRSETLMVLTWTRVERMF